MDDESVHPLEILSTYAQAGQFVEMRLARLRASDGIDPADIELAEGLSRVLFGGMLEAVSVIDECVTVVEETAPERMPS